MGKRKKILLLLAALIGFNLLVFGAFYFSINAQNSQSIKNPLTSFGENPNPTPFPFQELTIPYLKERVYESSLAERRQVEETSTYTGYLTSYDSDSLNVNGYLAIPKGEMPQGGWPAIVFVHGYIPPNSYQTLSNYSSYVDYLARNGFVVFKIDLRGHGSSEGEAGGSYFSGDYIIDVLNAKAALQGLEGVNPTKIGFWGHSMAGNVVTRAMAASPDTPAVAVWAGAVYTYDDMQEFGIDDNSYRPPSDDSPSRQERNKLFDTHGRFDSNSDFWKMVPFTNYLSDIKGAISLNHAKDDNVVSIEYSRNLANILDNNNVDFELNEYDGGGHNITGTYFNQAMQKTVNFFNERLR
jgi:uncharacterized protein